MKSLVSGTSRVGAAIGLALTPAWAGADDAAAVSYQDAMACSALFAVVSTSSETAEDEDSLIEFSAQWLLVAKARADTSRVTVDEAELKRWVDALTDELEGLADEDKAAARLFSMIDECEAIHAKIPDEFDAASGQ